MDDFITSLIKDYFGTGITYGLLTGLGVLCVSLLINFAYKLLNKA